MPAWVVDLLNRLNSTFVVDGRGSGLLVDWDIRFNISFLGIVGFGNRYSDGTYASVKK